jgi:hypothetical protein
MCVTYFECVSVALGILHSKRIGRILLSSVACLDLQYLINNTIWGNKVIEYKTFVLIFSTTFVCNVFHSWKNYHKCIYVLIYVQQDATLHSLFYLKTALHVSGGTSIHH